MNKKWVAAVAIVVSGMSAMATASAGDLVLDGKVTRIANTGNNLPVFSIQVTGGSTNLCSAGWITFTEAAAANSDAFKRAYAAALLALSTGMLVRVHNYQSNSCDTAAYIELAAP